MEIRQVQAPALQAHSHSRKNFRLLLDQGINTGGAQDLWWGALQRETQKPAQQASPSPAHCSGCCAAQTTAKGLAEEHGEGGFTSKAKGI